MENKRKLEMANNLVKQRKVAVTEDGMSTLLQRYTPKTIFTLLREVSEAEVLKFNWKLMAGKSNSGISNAREYQMLWRHLAYGNPLLDGLDRDSMPLDDDSDLECEVEAAPSASSEALAEASAYVKVLMASGSLNDTNGSNVEGPLFINIPPKGQMLKAPVNSNDNNCTQGTSIAIPVWVPKKPLPSNMNSEALEINGTGNQNRRKSKPWSPAADQKLINAVQKYGEGNWVDISKEEFKGDRTASQLSQRWGHLKKQGSLNLGNSPQLSEAQLAARHAVSMALDNNRPKLIAGQSNLGQRAGIETSRMGSHSRSVPPSPHNPLSTPHLGVMGMPKIRLPTEKPSVTNSGISDPDSMVKAAAIAAGARIATPAPDTPLLRPINSSLPSNVHFIRTGLVKNPLSSCPPSNTTSQVGGTGTTQVSSSSGRSLIPLSQPNLTAAAAASTSSSGDGKEKSPFNPVTGN